MMDDIGERYLPTYFGRDGERYDALAVAGVWTVVAYLELLRLGAWQSRGWRGSQNQLHASIRDRYGEAPRRADMPDILGALREWGSLLSHRRGLYTTFYIIECLSRGRWFRATVTGSQENLSARGKSTERVRPCREKDVVSEQSSFHSVLVPDDEHLLVPIRLRPLPARVEALASEAAQYGIGLQELAQAVTNLHGVGLHDLTDCQIRGTRHELHRALARSRGAT